MVYCLVSTVNTAINHVVHEQFVQQLQATSKTQPLLNPWPSFWLPLATTILSATPANESFDKDINDHCLSLLPPQPLPNDKEHQFLLQ
jgi:hypothetical protein